MMQLIELFGNMGYSIYFGTTATETVYTQDLTVLEVKVVSLRLNHDSFDDLLKDIHPSVVIYDRFMMEEQFGWRVREQMPDALTILDTEDLHFLRKAREESFKKKTPLNLYTQETKRELASILRCDLSLIISESELMLLTETFRIPTDLLFYLPLLYKSTPQFNSTPFNKRKHFVTLGNFMHSPNKDAIHWLKESIWQGIKSRLPSAEVHIYGAYIPKEIQAFHDPAEGFMIKGWIPDKEEVLQNAKVVLAPLRFGAGLKGKILDAIGNGTPVVTTKIGAEGILGTCPYEGDVADSEIDFVQKAVTLFSSQELWEKTSRQGLAIIKERFLQNRFEEVFSECIGNLLHNLSNHRKRHFVGQILHHESLQSKKFMSKWIALKNQG